MHLMITENQKFLIRFHHYSDNSQIEVFSLNPFQPSFTCKGRIIGFSRDSSLMIVWDGHYQAYDLAQAIALRIQEVNRADFEPEVLLDVRRADLGIRMQVFDVLSAKLVNELVAPEKPSGNKRVEGVFKIIGSPYAVLKLRCDWPEAIEGHIFDVATGKYQIMINAGIDHYQTRHKRLYLRGHYGTRIVEVADTITIGDVWLWPRGLLRRWPYVAVASFPNTRNLIALAQERAVLLFDISAQPEITEESGQVLRYKHSFRTKLAIRSYVKALCIEEMGRYIYISCDNGKIAIFDMEIKAVIERSQIPKW